MNDNARQLPPEDLSAAAAKRFAKAFEDTIGECIDRKLKPAEAIMVIAIACGYSLKVMGGLFATDTDTANQIAVKTLGVMRQHILLGEPPTTIERAFVEDLNAAVTSAILARMPPSAILAVLCDKLNQIGMVHYDSAEETRQ